MMDPLPQKRCVDFPLHAVNILKQLPGYSEVNTCKSSVLWTVNPEPDKVQIERLFGRNPVTLLALPLALTI